MLKTGIVHSTGLQASFAEYRKGGLLNTVSWAGLQPPDTIKHYPGLQPSDYNLAQGGYTLPRPFFSLGSHYYDTIITMPLKVPVKKDNATQ